MPISMGKPTANEHSSENRSGEEGSAGNGILIRETGAKQAFHVVQISVRANASEEI